MARGGSKVRHSFRVRTLPIIIAAAMALMQSVPATKADTASINFSLGQLTSGGSSIVNGSLFLVSWYSNTGATYTIKPGFGYLLYLTTPQTIPMN
jgi:hypothetical protein